MSEDFVHLHTHTDFSTLDGAGKAADYVKKAELLGQPAIAFTDHGTMRGAMKLYEECKEHSAVKPVYGIEFYVSRDMHRRGVTDEEKADITKGLKKGEHRAAVKQYEEREGIRDRWHITVWAKDNDGLKNLYRLSSSAWIDGFYYKPRIDINELLKFKKGLIVATGCLNSPINDLALAGKKSEAIAIADRLSEELNEDLWLEIQPHDIHDQALANRMMLDFRKRYGKHKLLATQDAHYVNADDAEHHEVLLCIGTNDVMSNPARFRFDGNQFWFKTRKEMKVSFERNHNYMSPKTIKRALDATVELASQCTAQIETDYHKALIPSPGIPKKFHGDTFAYLKELCIYGWTWRRIPDRILDYASREGVGQREATSVYINRLKHELGALKRQKFVPYFLLVHDLYRFARGAGIMTGPGRGSVGGSLVAYLLGITAIDPLEHHLIFERFINPYRVDEPDADMDFEDKRRHEIMDYLRGKYGADKACQIATVGKLSGKACIRDVSRVLEVPLNEVNQVTNSIIERSSGDERASQTIEDSFNDFDVCRKFNEKYPDVLRHAKKLENMSKTLGMHAAGIVTSPVTLTDLIPLETRKHEGRDIVVSAWDMYGVAAAGLVKLDVLGLRTLTVIKDCLNEIERRHGRRIDMESSEVTLNDPRVLEGFTKHDYGGVFQYDTPSADKVCQGVNFTSFEDVAAMTALNRPGTSRSGLATKYVQRKKNPKLVKKVDFHPAVSKITSDTLGIIVYQEHVIRIFTDIAGFAPGTADSLRKTIAKKIGDETLGREREAFVKGALEHTPGMTEAVANKIMDAITFFGSYGFNKCLVEETVVIRPGANAWTRPEVTIGQLYEAQNSDTPWGEKIRSGRLNILQMDDDGRVRPGRLKAIYKNGTKIVWRVRTNSGRVIDATENHRFLTAYGYQTVEKLLPGTPMVCMGEPEVYVKKGHQTDRAKGGSYRGRKGGLGTPKGRCNPAWIDGRSKAFQEAKVIVRIRSKGRCECCETSFLGRYEFAHQNTLEQCGGDYVKFNSADNIRLMCNSCHKKLDYQKGERKPRWTKGRPTKLEQVVSVHKLGERETYDVEMDTDAHNFIANGFVSHNSHATAYGMIAYWEMWLKTYYPIEFYWALLKSEPDRIRIQQIAKDAKRHGIALLPPHVSTSNAQFSIDDKSAAIRGSLVDIKGVGEKAAAAIMAAQPYGDMIDFIDRVNRRCVHKGVVVALTKAGAMSGLVPNARHFIENVDDCWKLLGNKGAKESARKWLEDSKSQPDYSEEERGLVASRVNPLAFGQHPVDAYRSFMKREVKVPLVNMESEEFFKDYDGRGLYVAGVMVEVRYNQVGDFHTGELPSEEERKKQFWGARYANVNIEDRTGKQNRFKFDIEVFDRCRPVIDKGVGTPVIVHATASSFTQTLRAQFVVNLSEYREKIKAGKDLDVWERVIHGEHPSLSYPWKDEESRKKRGLNCLFWKSKYGGVFTGLVTNVRLKYDKNGNLMSFFGMLDGAHNFIDVICFSSVWESIAHIVKEGHMLKMDIDRKPDRQRGWCYFFSGGRVKVLSKRDRAEIKGD